MAQPLTSDVIIILGWLCTIIKHEHSSSRLEKVVVLPLRRLFFRRSAVTRGPPEYHPRTARIPLGKLSPGGLFDASENWDANSCLRIAAHCATLFLARSRFLKHFLYSYIYILHIYTYIYIYSYSLRAEIRGEIILATCYPSMPCAIKYHNYFACKRTHAKIIQQIITEVCVCVCVC